MSGFEALGMASSVLQVISFTVETVKLCKSFYEGADIDGSLNDKTASMTTAADAMKEHANHLILKGPGNDDLLDIAKKCAETAKKVKDEVDKYDSQKSKDNVLRAMGGAFKRYTRQGTLKKLEQELNEYRSIMELQILVRLLKQGDVMTLLQSQQIDTSSTSFQGLANEFASGQRDLLSLINQSRAQTLDTVVAESRRIETTMEGHFTETQRHTLRASVKYPGMNQRWNQITVPESDTYGWVLQPETKSPADDNPSAVTSSSSRPQCSGKPWPDFPSWLQGNDPRWYWITGKPGSGKSTLLKFLATHGDTRTYVKLWDADVTILQHCFWKPEGGLKCSIKGLWCSLAHQLLCSDDQLANWALRSTDIRQNGEYHDWGDKTIKDFCLSLLLQSDQAHCIFVDGLDEVDDADGAHALLETLDELQDLPGRKIKLCVSSRLEPVFTKRLSSALELKLHILSKKDLETYTWSCLKAFQTGDDERRHGFLEDIAQSLLEKADGVFLWLILALKSVTRGLENVDTEEEILLRVEQLPADISSLYRDMWNRLNADEPIYRASAARIFSFMIERRRLSESAALMEVAFALDLDTADKVIEGKLRLYPKDKVEMIEKAGRAVELRCGGLLKIERSTPGRYRGDDNDYVRPRKEIEEKSPHQPVSFIHRTAYDYLTTTSHGREISGYESPGAGTVSLNVSKSMLACWRCLGMVDSGNAWVGFHLHKPSQLLQFTERAFQSEDQSTVRSATAFLDLCCELWDTSRTCSGDAEITAPLCSHLLSYRNLLGYVLRKAPVPNTTEVLHWNVKLEIVSLRSNKEHRTADRSPLAERIRRCMDAGAQTDQKLKLPLCIGEHQPILVHQTLFETFVSGLLCQVHKSRELTQQDVLDLAESILALRPSIEDMSISLPLVRNVVQGYRVDNYGSVFYPMRDYLAPLHEKMPYPKTCFTTSSVRDRISRSPGDYLTLSFLIEANASFIVSRALRRLLAESAKSGFDFSPPKELVALLQSVDPTARVSYILGVPEGDSSNPVEDEGGPFAFRCAFDSEGNHILIEFEGSPPLREDDYNAHPTWKKIESFLLDQSRQAEMQPIDGYIADSLLEENTWGICKAPA